MVRNATVSPGSFTLSSKSKITILFSINLTRNGIQMVQADVQLTGSTVGISVPHHQSLQYIPFGVVGSMIYVFAIALFLSTVFPLSLLVTFTFGCCRDRSKCRSGRSIDLLRMPKDA